jgi:TrmH family RNA methyltransferase
MPAGLEQLAVVLVRPRNTLNIGAVARAMSNFGASDLRLVSVFHRDFRSAASATGPAAQLLEAAREFATLGEALADCTLAVGTTGALGRAWDEDPEPLGQAAARVRAHIRGGGAEARAALVFGSEKTGLSNDDLSLCQLSLRIPTREEHASMNLGQAAAVCLYELARAQSSSTPSGASPPPPPPRQAELLRVDGLLHELLQAAEYPGIESPHRQRQLRLLVRRLGMQARDAPHWTGILRHVLGALRRG